MSRASSLFPVYHVGYPGGRLLLERPIRAAREGRMRVQTVTIVGDSSHGCSYPLHSGIGDQGPFTTSATSGAAK